MPLFGAPVLQSKSFRLPSAAELLSLCVAKEKVTKEKGHPAWRLPPIHGRQVREPGPGFSIGHPALAKRSRHPCRLPLRGLSTPPHRRTGAPGRAAGHPGPHFWREPEQSHSTVRGLSCSSTRQELQSQLLSDRLRL